MHDFFEIIGDIPKGTSYQWVVTSVFGSVAVVESIAYDMKRGGWRPVPAERHPQMPSREGIIQYGGQVLMERPLALTLKAQEAEKEKALALQVQGEEAKDCSVTSADFFQAGTCVDQKQMDEARSRLKVHDGRSYAEVSLTIGVVLTDGEIETAVSMRMDEKEYAKRKFLMRAHALLLINDHTFGDRGHVKIFDFVREEW